MPCHNCYQSKSSFQRLVNKIPFWQNLDIKRTRLRENKVFSQPRRSLPILVAKIHHISLSARKSRRRKDNDCLNYLDMKPSLFAKGNIFCCQDPAIVIFCLSTISCMLYIKNNFRYLQAKPDKLCRRWKGKLT